MANECIRVQWDDKEFTFLDGPSNERIKEVTALCPEFEPCYSCGLQVQEHEKMSTIFSEEAISVSIYGIKYHIYDTVYVQPNKQDEPYQLAWITKIDTKKEKVWATYFEHADEEVCLESFSID
jgi:hypothetical protein